MRDFIAVEDSGRGIAPAGPSGVAGVAGMDSALALLREAAATAVGDAALWDFREAADFAGTVEELSRVAEYLQVVAAGAVDRTREQATAAPKASTAWTTGWRDDSADGTGGPGNAFGAAAADGETAWATGWRDDSGHGSTGPDDASGAVAASRSGGAAGSVGAVAASGSGGAAESRMAVDDGYRNTTEFLRARLRISAAEARRRLALAGDLLPRQGFSGDPLPPVREELGAAVAAGEVSSRAATIITLALDRVRHTCNPEAAAGMEHALTRTAAENDPDLLALAARNWTDALDQDGAEPTEELLRQLQGAFIRKPRHGLSARNWTDALDQDGAEPTEELLRQLQGAFIRKPRHGLQHLEIFATAEQFEHLLTVMNNATNPRTTPTRTGAAPGDEGGAADCEGPSGAAGTPENDPGAACLDLRSQQQKRLDGLVGACKVALATGSLPATGGLRPQVMVTIDYRDLLARLEHITSDADRTGTSPDHTTASEATGPFFRPNAPKGHTGNMLFTGPVTAATARKMACDADIIPVLLGGEGRILDIGRASRVFPPHIRKALTARDQGCAFPGCTIPAPWCEAHHITPPHIRKALTARDQGCAFPGCTIPAPWCEAHHITYWSRGGPTGTENGVLLCSHHHHVIHKEQWTIQIRTGIPWFIPPPHIDPRQKHHHHVIHKEQWTIQIRTGIPWFIPPPHIDPRQNPRRNNYFHPANLNTAA
ncbi:hypothetical protein ASE96_12955 [Arthrobacter sp. Leaf69]|nr:hypothetical protein ASE96_12955 [Arthrobacter sp. Leaf69]